MGKIADKVAKAKNKAKAKVAAKIGKTGKKKVCIAIALATIGYMLVTGCATSGEQPARSQTQHNDIRDCIIIAGASKVTVSNKVVVAEAEIDPATIELFTQTQANEGSETVSPTATPTLTVDTDADLNLTK